jgi:long-subunit fatty acid transport protein
MKVVRTIVGAAAVAVCCGLGTGTAYAQANDEVFPQFQWNFSTPGARANAMGRAFIGTADDASASISNPAGLIRLTRPQGYFEFKSTDLKVSRLRTPDSLFTLKATETSQTINAPSFFSVSVPLMNNRVAVAFTRNEFLNYQESFKLDPRPIPGVDLNFLAVDAETDFRAVSYAGSLAVRVNPKFNVGVTVSSDHLTGKSRGTRLDIIEGDRGNQFDLHADTTVVNETTIDDTASGMSVVAGALYLPNDKISVGVQVATGSTFEVDEDLRLGNGDAVAGFPETVTIHVPMRFGAGIGVRPTPRLLVQFDFVRIGYSSLAKDFTLIFDRDTLNGDEFEVDDVIETHAGAEYLLFQGRNSMFVRAGVYTSPNHNTRFTGTADVETNATQQAFYNLLPRDTEVIGTFGVGFVLGSRAQADIAVVGKAKEIVGSIGVRF